MHLNTLIQMAGSIDDLAGFDKICLGDDEDCFMPYKSREPMY
jgi:hypothetical protein